MTGDRAETTGVGRIDWLALAIVGIGGVLLRLLYLDQPMRYDEAYSFLYFALPSLRTAVSDYTVPNNHIFHTVLVWISTHLFGSSPQAIRLPVFFAGLLSVPAAWFAARSLAGRGAGLFAAALTAVLPSLLLYSTNARAYMLVGLGTLLLVWVGSRLLDEESLSHWMVIVVIGALGLWAAPVMLYPLGVVMWWLLAERVRTDGARGALRFVPRLGAAAALIGVLTIILYLPVLLRGGAGQLTNNRFVKPGTWAEVATQLVILARDLRALLGLGLSRVEVVLALLIALVGVGAPGEHRQRRITLASATTVWCLALMLITRRLPPPRVLLFLAPMGCLFLGVGFSWLASRLRAERIEAQAIAATLVFALLAAQEIRSRSVLASEETDWIGMRDARDIANLILGAPSDDRVVINRSSEPPLDYYLFQLTHKRLEKFMGPTHRGRVLLVLDDRHGQTIARVLRVHPEINWDSLGQPTLLRRFPGSSVYAFGARAP